MRFLVVAGGTGGHLSPAIAFCEELLSKKNEVFFVGTGAKIEEDFCKNLNIPFFKLDVSGIKGKGIKAVSGVVKAFLGVVTSLKLINQIKPDFVMGFGGYVSGPVLLSAKILKKKIAIHESNVFPGFTNSILSKISDIVFLAFEDSLEHFKRKKNIHITGTPIRKKFKEDHLLGSSTKTTDEKIRILIVGGSQGAKGMNSLVVETFGNLNEVNNQNTEIIHQTGKLDFIRVQKMWNESGVKSAITVKDFIQNIGFFMAWADFGIFRGGAATLSEMLYSELPSIIVPFPFASDDHQFYNGLYFAKRDAALLCRQGEKEKFKKYVLKLLDKKFRNKIKKNLLQLKTKTENAALVMLNIIEDYQYSKNLKLP